MLRNILIISSLLACSFTLFSQPGQMRRQPALEQIEAEKIAFFTRYLELNSKEAKEFWPVYDDFQNRKNLLIQERQNLSRYFTTNFENLPENEAEKLADRYISLQVKETDLAGEFHEKFKKVLPSKKVMRFYQAENEFRMQLLRRIRRGGNQSGMGMGNHN
jgi:hypothetical protein